MGVKRDPSYPDDESLIDRLEAKIRHLPSSLNETVANSLKSAALFSQYRFFFDSDLRQQQSYLRQCPALHSTYTRLFASLNTQKEVGEWFEVTQACIDAFSSATGDHQWIHSDPQKAKKHSPFRQTIAQGFLTLSLIPVLTKQAEAQQITYPGARMVINAGLNRVYFPYPVKAGKKIRAISTITGLTPMKRGLEVVREVKIEIENSNRLACIAEPVVKVYF